MTEGFILFLIAVCFPVGLLIRITIRKTKPTWCKSFIKFGSNRKWWLFAFSAVMLTVASISTFSQGAFYLASLFLLLACFQVFCFFKYGFKSLTPEQEAKIDAFDPTKIWPRRFWK